MKQKLLDKYNVPVPRYTSYPPANYFHDGFNDYDFADAKENSAKYVEDFFEALGSTSDGADSSRFLTE